MPQSLIGRIRAISPRAPVALFFAAFLALGLLTAAQYGQPWDEVDEMEILRMNMWEYSRATGLDEEVFTRWAEPNGLSLNPLTPISESIERDHGVAALYPLAPAALSFTLSQSARQLIWHMYCWALFTLGAFATYACCRELGLSRAAGLLAALFLLLSPRFFAEGHYNSKDVVLMSLVACMLWQSLKLARKPAFGGALLFALFGALAANTKIAGLALWGLCALYVLVSQAMKRALKGRALLIGGVALVSFIGFYALLTPAMWRAPAEYIKYLASNAVNFSRWKNSVRFRGVTYDTSVHPLPFFYLPYIMLATTPLWLSLMTAVGQVRAIAGIVGKSASHKRPDSPMALCLISLMWALPLGFAILTGTSVYNSWRHFYFVNPPLIILAAYGTSGLWGRLRGMRPKCLKPAFAVMLALCMVFTGVGIAINHPYQYVYYQPLEQLIWKGESYQELDYWNVSVQNALQKLCEQTEGEPVISYVDIWSETGLKRGVYGLPDELQARIKITDEASEADYLLVNPTYAEIGSLSLPKDIREAVAIEAYGRVIMRIYAQEAGV